MGKLHLALLSTPEVRHAGEVLTFPTRKTLALLIYLAVEKGLHSREKLTAFFWPESDVTRGRAPLRNTLGHLRSVLREAPDEHDAQKRMQQLHLLIERDTLGFNLTSNCEIDISIVEAAFTLVRSPESASNVRGDVRIALLTQLQRATTSYRGSFLAGFSLGDAPAFDDWASIQREVWHRRASLLFDRLAQLQFEGGELVSAIDTAACWTAHDPLSEVAYQRLMRLHFAAGNREAALATYETYRLRLVQELHAQPTATMKALAERIRTSAPSLRRVPQEARLPLSPSAVLEGSFPFVGRMTEYVTLVESYHRASKGQPQVVILEGEAGIGKTRLAREFLGWAMSQGADVLQGQAFETGGRLPYQPLVEALRPRLERENAPDDLLSDIWLTELSRLLPELRDRYPDLPASAVDETLARTRLFEAVARLGQALAERTPLVVFLDNIHWADAASLDMLHYASRHWRERSSPLLLLLSLRSEALLATPSLADWLSGLERDLTTASLALKPLTFDATLQLVWALVQEQPQAGCLSSPPIPRPSYEGFQGKSVEGREHAVEQFGRWLFSETKGQPFFMMETLRVLLERGVVVARQQEDGGWVLNITAAIQDEAKLRGLLPPNVREVIRRRLVRLSPTASGLLAAGAVLGQGFSFERLCRVAGSGENEGLSALDELLLGRLLQGSKEERRAEVVYFFTHDKIREVVYTEAGEARRHVFHRRALEALQAVAAPSAQLAHHALHARLLEPSFRFSLMAGDDAMRLFAVNDALVHYEQSQQVLVDWTDEQDQRAGPSVVDVEHLYVQLGRAYELSSDHHKAQSVYEAMLTFARERHKPTIECVALNRLATLAAWKSYDMETAEKLLQEALLVAESSGHWAGLAETEWNLAQMNFYAFRAQEARLHAERALAMARELNLQELIARSLSVLAYAHMRLGNLKEMIVHAEEARARYTSLGDRAKEADSLSLLAIARLHTGLLQAGIQAARSAWAISVEIENAWGQMFSATNLALGLRESGAYGEALAFARQGVHMARTGFPPNLILTLFRSGVVQATVFALEPSRTALLEATALNEHVKSRSHGEALATALCMDAALAGEWKEAYTYTLQALAARDYCWSYGWHFTLWYETEALLRGGDAKLAEENVRHFGEFMKDNRRYRIAYLRALAVLAHWQHENRQAVAHLQEAVQLAEAIGLSGERWQILATLGELYRQEGDEQQAHLAFACAAEIVQSLANTLEDQQERLTFLAAESIRHVLQHASA